MKTEGMAWCRMQMTKVNLKTIGDANARCIYWDLRYKPEARKERNTEENKGANRSKRRVHMSNNFE